VCSSDLEQGLAPPLVLQPYVPHRPPLFKVFVLGPSVALARRPSLHVPAPPEDVTAAVGGALALARVSAYTSPEEEAGAGGGGGGASPPAPTSPDPPGWVLEALAAELRCALGLQVFNFDLIRVARDLMPPAPGRGPGGSGVAGGGPGGGGARTAVRPPPGPCPPAADYLVIDINYFPGIEKLPGYEGLMVAFLEWVTGPEGTAATTGWEAGLGGGGRAGRPPSDAGGPAPGVAVTAALPPRPSSGLPSRLSMSLSQVPASTVSEGGEASVGGGGS
jgi:inositol-1,3,4-trisphosphate 5/6-kinase/inositol-tetrakisphosphate 1-kinase